MYKGAIVSRHDFKKLRIVNFGESGKRPHYKVYLDGVPMDSTTNLTLTINKNMIAHLTIGMYVEVEFVGDIDTSIGTSDDDI